MGGWAEKQDADAAEFLWERAESLMDTVRHFKDKMAIANRRRNRNCNRYCIANLVHLSFTQSFFQVLILILISAASRDFRPPSDYHRPCFKQIRLWAVEMYINRYDYGPSILFIYMYARVYSGKLSARHQLTAVRVRRVRCLSVSCPSAHG